MFELRWDDDAKAEVKALGAFRRKAILEAIDEQLRFQPDIQTKNRKPLRGPIADLPAASWELRVHGSLRVLYRIDEGQTVVVLRVILKDTAKLADAVGRGRAK